MMQNEARHTREELKMRQALPLNIKIRMTENRIRAWINEFGADGVYVSFSGGKDSTVLLDIVRNRMGYKNIPAVFVDTGLEYPEIREFVKTVPNVTWLYPIRWDKHKKQWIKTNFQEVIKTYGYPIISKEQAAFIQEYKTTQSDKLKDIRLNGNKYGRGKISNRHKYLIDAPFDISDKCCDIMKKNPAKHYEKETGFHPILGTMAEESDQRKSNWLMYGCNAFEGKRPNSRPISFWTEQDILKYIKQFNLSYAPVYGKILQDDDGRYYTTGCNRTGCMFCGFGCHLEKEGEGRFEKMKITHPKLYDYIMKPKEEGGLDYKNIIDWMNEHGKLSIRY